MSSGDAMQYMNRRWADLAASKREHWAREFAERGHAATFSAAQALWLHMRAVRPDWPSAEQRDEDLAHHVQLKKQLDRAGRAFSGR